MYKCKLCGYLASNEDFFSEAFRCPKCGVDRYNFLVFEEMEEIDKRVRIDKNNYSINRILEKCINCGVCKNACKRFTGIEYDYKKSRDALCVNCGACLLNCPTGAITPRYDYKSVFNEIVKDEKVVVVFTAPAVRVGLGECFGLKAGENVQGKMVSSLRKLGFDYVLDTTLGADITILEEANELLERLEKNKNLPMFTSCCPSWVKYVEMFNPDFISNLSTTKSPNAIMGALVKSYFAREKGIDSEKIVTVGIVPCTSKKYEASRKELVNNGLKNLDYILTTTELAFMIKEKNIDFNLLEDDDFDSLMGKGSSSGIIFGSSGGVMEASIRTINYLLTGNNMEESILNSDIRGNNFFREASFKIGDKIFNVAVVYGLVHAQRLLEKIRNGEVNYHFVEVMTCDNGCVGGSGQILFPINKLEEVRISRLNSLSEIDKISKVKFSYENEEVIRIYQEFFRKNKKLTHELTHAEYSVK